MNNKAIKITIIVLSAILALLVAAVIIVQMQRAQEELPENPPDIIEETPDSDLNRVEVESISIVLESTEMPKGTRFLPELIILPLDASDKFVELRSDNERVVRQQGQNWVAVEIGTANLIASATNGVQTIVEITVLPPNLEFMKFHEAEVIIELGDVLELIPEFTPIDAGLPEPIVYSSNNESVAEVSEDGKIRAVGPGDAVITGTTGEITAEIKVRVVISARNITVSFNRRVFGIGEQAEFTIKVEPENATNAEVSVSFSGAAVTSTGTNRFRCDEAGEVEVTFSAEGVRPLVQTIVVHDLVRLADDVHRITNTIRADANLSQLGRISLLTDVALLRAREVREPNNFSHTRPDGREFFTAFTDIGLERRFAGENLAEGHTSPVEVVQAWMDSTMGHRENILSTDFGNLGVGITIGNNGKLYWVQIFMN